MSKTLVIYDSVGYVISQITGSYRVPTGIPYLKLDIPEGKQVATKDGIGIDVSGTPHQVILEDIPLNETERLKQKIEVQEQKLAEQEQAILELTTLLAGGTTNV